MPKPKFPWISKRTKTMPELPYEPPIWMGPHSNGEYFVPQSPYERKLRKFILQKADENARRVGMDRREFMASAMGMTTTLWCINFASGCSSDSESGGGGSGSAGYVINPPPGGGAGGVVAGGAGGVAPGGAGGTPPIGGSGGTPPVGGAGGSAGGACVPDAMFDEQAACAQVGGNEFIFDVQTHWFSQADTVRFPPNVLQLFGVLFLAANENEYINQIFMQSDTTMTVLTSWPGSTCSPDPANTDPCGLPLSNPSMADSRDRINALACNTQRVVQHVQVLPNDGLGLQTQLDIMTQMHCERKAHGWKLYPGFASNSIDPRGSTGYFLDEPNARAVIEHGLSLGIPRFSVHKGLQIGSFFEVEHNHPRDVGVVAAAYPAAQFIIYHSAIDAGVPLGQQAPGEGPYDPAEPNPTSVNALIRSLQDNGIQPGQNVYAEIGTTIDRLMTNPTAAAHFFGKLMLYVGVDNICWGTDCVIGGSPQGRIEWFRGLSIPQSMQDQYGYAPLDATAKGKIFGLNAARLYGIDTAAMRCHVNSCGMADLKRHFDEEFGGRRWMFQTPGGPKTWEEHVEHNKRAMKLGRPG